MKRVMLFCKKGKLSPQHIRPYRISKRVGNVSYELQLPLELATVHLVFHISTLKKCLGDPSLIVPTKTVGIQINYPGRKLQFKSWIVKFTSCEQRNWLQLRSFGGTNLLKKGLGKLRMI